MKIDHHAKKRVRLPVGFDGPICAECVHVRRSKGDNLPANGHDWLCSAGEPILIDPAETNPVTGKVHEARYASRPLCHDKNGSGDCGEFDRNPAAAMA